MKEIKHSPLVRPNIIDRVVGFFNPVAGAQRYLARGKMALVGGYHGGSHVRAAMRNFKPGAGSPEVDINLSLPDLRPRSRDLARNCPPATSAIGTNVTHVIGTGLAMQPRIHRDILGLEDEAATEWESTTKRKFELWANSRLCDAEMTNTFPELQAIVFRSMLESGDVLALLPQIDRPGWPYKLAIQLVEADRLSNPNRRMDSESIIGGVEVGKYGEPVNYHITSHHPGSITGRAALKWTAVPAFGSRTGRRNVLHVYETLRPGQKRGVPYLSSVLEQLKQLERYTDAELQAAVISAAFAIFVKMDHEAFAELFDEESQKAVIAKGAEWDGSIESGKAVNMLPGESIETASPGRPNSEFDPFVTSILRQIGMALELPYEVLILHFQSSYSAARAALMSAWRVFRKRREFMTSKFCQPIYEEWLAEAVASGDVKAPGFFADPLLRAAWCSAKWTGDAPGAIDPKKEVDAAKGRVELGISTLDAESILHDGEEWESKHNQQVKERKARLEAGLISEGPAALSSDQINKHEAAESEDEENEEESKEPEAGEDPEEEAGEDPEEEKGDQ